MLIALAILLLVIELLGFTTAQIMGDVEVLDLLGAAAHIVAIALALAAIFGA